LVSINDRLGGKEGKDIDHLTPDWLDTLMEIMDDEAAQIEELEF
jgi:hypothetical protein